MKATGIVRRIDDLGRVVIPKEIRRTMRIREGDPLEIFISNDGEVVFKKYSPIYELGEFAVQICDILNKTTKLPVVVCDKDNVIAVSGIPKKEMLERRISPQLENLINQRKTFLNTHEEHLCPVEGVERFAVVCVPVLSGGDVYGSIILMSGDKETYPDELQVKLLEVSSQFIGNQMDE